MDRLKFSEHTMQVLSNYEQQLQTILKFRNGTRANLTTEKKKILSHCYKEIAPQHNCSSCSSSWLVRLAHNYFIQKELGNEYQKKADEDGIKTRRRKSDEKAK